LFKVPYVEGHKSNQIPVTSRDQRVVVIDAKDVTGKTLASDSEQRCPGEET
jgi:hypothetical protein